MVLKSPLEFKKLYGDLRSCRSSDETLDERLELYLQKKAVTLPMPLGAPCLEIYRSDASLAGVHVYRGVSQALHVDVFTLDRLSLPEKRILNI